MGIRDFRNKAYTICNELNVSVLKFYECGITPNFEVAHITKNNTNLFVLCSFENHWAYSSFFLQAECRLDFVDFPEFSELLSNYYNIEPYYSVELNEPFTNRYNNLESDVKYWKPQIEGDGLFNWWD
jgi:hypothetical protein